MHSVTRTDFSSAGFVTCPPSGSPFQHLPSALKPVRMVTDSRWIWSPGQWSADLT